MIDLLSKEKLRDDDEILFSLSHPNNLHDPIDKMGIFYAISQKYGLKKEYENVLDIIWRINKDVQHIMYRKLMNYEHNFNFGKDHWIDIILQHVIGKVEDVELKEHLSKKFLKNVKILKNSINYKLIYLSIFRSIKLNKSHKQ